MNCAPAQASVVQVALRFPARTVWEVVNDAAMEVEVWVAVAAGTLCALPGGRVWKGVVEKSMPGTGGSSTVTVMPAVANVSRIICMPHTTPRSKPQGSRLPLGHL